MLPKLNTSFHWKAVVVLSTTSDKETIDEAYENGVDRSKGNNKTKTLINVKHFSASLK